jgi:hypothetical protein
MTLQEFTNQTISIAARRRRGRNDFSAYINEHAESRYQNMLQENEYYKANFGNTDDQERIQNLNALLATNEAFHCADFAYEALKNNRS